MFEGHPSWRSILGFYIKGLLLSIVVGAIAYFAGGDSAGLAAAAGGGLFALVIVVGLIKRVATTY
jgi:hypothetical protein